jgi:predicted N-acyltransferase
MTGLSVRFHPSIAEVPEPEWDALFPGSPERWAFYRAAEEAAPGEVWLGAVTVRSACGALVAAAPAFRIAYRLDTPFQGRLRIAMDRLNALWPGLARIGVLGLGSPMSDGLSLGFAPAADEPARAQALSALLDGLMAEGHRRKGTILALKGLAGENAALEHVLAGKGFGKVTSVPVAMLPLPRGTLDDYLASLPRKRAAYFRRKLAPKAALRIEYRTNIDGLENEIHSLYEATLAQSNVGYGDLDKLPPGFFARLLARMGEDARLMLCWQDDRLVSFQVFLVGTRRIVAYKIGMRYPEARDLNLYFINWLEMIEFATGRGISEIEMGATSYASKLLFGGHLERRWLHFRFRRPLSNRISRTFHHHFDFEANDAELQKLAAEGPIAGLEPRTPAK